MSFDPEYPHAWFTAGELADLACLHNVAGVPTTQSGMIKWIRRELTRDPDGFGSILRSYARKRAGRKGGGGLEYHWTVFADAGADMRRALRAEIERRAIATVVTLAGGLHEFSLEDEALMRVAAVRDDHRHVWFAPFAVRRVRRGCVTVDYRAYWHPSLRALEGSDVIVSWILEHPPHPVFLWRYDPVLRQLLCHGERGFIGMAEPPLNRHFPGSIGWIS